MTGSHEVRGSIPLGSTIRPRPSRLLMPDSTVATALILYDTKSAKKRPLETLVPRACSIYNCGPTVYDMSHVGHARAALVPDILVRFLRYRSYRVTYVRNITDLDDKIIDRARTLHLSAEEIAERYTKEYHRDLSDLNMLSPDIEPRVTRHMEQILRSIEALLDKGLAYEVDGDVYFRVDRFEAYGGLSGRRPEDMQAGARVEVDSRKENPFDFALWKSAKEGEPAWESPWGAGRPGWHIECSVMSTEHLGETFDIHAGGRDLIFPHHENEIAQSQGIHGHDTYARHWMHNGFVNFAGEKMSKSLGNFFTIREVTALYHPEVLRAFLMSVHYRSGINFDVEVHCSKCDAVMPNEEQQAGRCEACGHETSAAELRSRVRFPGLEEADERLAYVYETLRAAKDFLQTAKAPAASRKGADAPVTEAVGGMLGAFEKAMCDDLNTAAATAALSEPLSEVNRLLASGKGVDKALRYATIVRFVGDMKVVSDVLGLYGRDPAEFLLERRQLKARRIGLDVERVQDLLEARAQARNDKDWARADQVRDELSALGVNVRDGADGSEWSL